MGILFTSISVIFCCVFIGGSITNIYGTYCGIDLYNPISWLNSLILHGSPYCKFLNSLAYYSHYILENLYIYILLGIITKVSKYLPFMNIENNNRFTNPFNTRETTPTHDTGTHP
jgi:hypothetical protein